MHRSFEQRLLRREVAEHCALRDARSARDVFHARRAEASLGELGQARFQDLGPDGPPSGGRGLADPSVIISSLHARHMIMTSWSVSCRSLLRGHGYHKSKRTSGGRTTPRRTEPLCFVDLGSWGTCGERSGLRCLATHLASTSAPSSEQWPGPVLAIGRLVPRSRVVTIAPPFGGGDARIAQLLVIEGETVSEGTLLATLDSAPSLAAALAAAEAQRAHREAALAQTKVTVATSLAEAEAALARAEASLPVLRRDLERAEALAAGGATPLQTLDQRRLAHAKLCRTLLAPEPHWPAMPVRPTDSRTFCWRSAVSTPPSPSATVRRPTWPALISEPLVLARC